MEKMDMQITENIRVTSVKQKYSVTYLVMFGHICSNSVTTYYDDDSFLYSIKRDWLWPSVVKVVNITDPENPKEIYVDNEEIASNYRWVLYCENRKDIKDEKK